MIVTLLSCPDAGCGSCPDCLATDLYGLALADDEAWLAARPKRREVSG